jgi:hypothetical protein
MISSNVKDRNEPGRSTKNVEKLFVVGSVIGIEVICKITNYNNSPWILLCPKFINGFIDGLVNTQLFM